MRAHVAPYVTLISKVLSEIEGELFGTGSYVEFGGKTSLLTKDHVACHLAAGSLDHQFWGSDTVARLRRAFFTEPLPVDVAASRIGTDVWSASPTLD